MPQPEAVHPDEIDWETCSTDECDGAVLADGQCARHLGEAVSPDLVAAALRTQHEGGVLDLRGVSIDRPLLAACLAAGTSSDGTTALEQVRFDWATFEGPVALVDVTFRGETGFTGTTFRTTASFTACSFERSPSFQGATFGGAVTFSGVEFRRGALFESAVFERDLQLADTTFRREPSFRRASFAAVTLLGGVFRRGANFEQCVFGGTLTARQVRFPGDTTFAGATFAAVEIDGVVALAELKFDGATATAPFLAQGAARILTCRGTQFREPATFELRRSEVVLDNANFAAPSVVTIGDPTPGEEELLSGWTAIDPDSAQRSERPRILSLQRSNVENLTLGQVDLRACRFFGAYNLAKLSIEAADAFGTTPASRRWTRRQTIAEEHEWRRVHGPDAEAWYQGAIASPPGIVAVKPLVASDVATLYRALRRGREDEKDEPGAADFYYGEMEMRRHAWRDAKAPGAADELGSAAKRRAEHATLTAYWAVSGYGLRASRALLLLAAVLALLTVALHAYGFQDRVRPFARPADVQRSQGLAFPPPADEIVAGLTSADAWAFSVGTATSVIGAPESQLTSLGRVFRIVLRIMGPLLIALALLAIRGRVKR